MGEDTKEESKEEAAQEEPVEDIEEAVRQAQDAVTLTDEEMKACWFPKHQTPDLTQKDLARYFGDFTMPDKSEGFDEVRFAWQDQTKCSEYLKKWVSERKLTQKVDDLQAGSYFKEQLEAWNKQLQEWRRKQNDRRNPAKQNNEKRR